MRCASSAPLAHRLAILAYIVFALFPLFWLVKVSVTPNDLLYTEGVRLWPSRITFEHFDFVLTHSDFPLFFRNSLIVSASTAVIVTVLAALAGYALSRFAFRGKLWIVGLMLVTQMFPLVMLVAPIFKMLSPLGLTNSLTGLVIVYTAFNVPFATFLMQSFFDGIPNDLEEAAMIDGATPLHRLPPDHPAADAAGHRRDARLRLHGRLERAALRADADLRQRRRRPSRSACSPSSPSSRSTSAR